MFSVNGENYDFKFSNGRIKQIETRIGKSIIAEMTACQGLFSLNTLDAIFTLCTIREGGNGYLPPNQGRETCEQAMDEIGYAGMLENIANALQRDCPFLFRTRE